MVIQGEMSAKYLVIRDIPGSKKIKMKNNPHVKCIAPVPDAALVKNKILVSKSNG